MELFVEILRKEVCEEITNKTLETFDELCKIWKHSYNEDTIAKYAKRLIQHVGDLFADLIEEAEATRSVLINNVEELMEKVSAICKVLSEPLPTESFQDLPLHDACEMMRDKFEYFNNILEERKLEINDLLAKEAELCDELGCKGKGLPQAVLPSSKELQAFQKHLDIMQAEIITREEDLKEIREDVARIFDELEIKASLEIEAVIIGSSKIKVTDANMNHVKNIHADYQAKLEASKITVMELREKLSQLWERLEEEPVIRTEFLRKHKGHGVHTAMALRNEIAKCEERKRNNIRIFIEKIRNEISCFWEQCMMSKEERAGFDGFECDYFTEDLLTCHEMYLEKLEQFYQSNQKIFELLLKRTDLWDKLNELETKANDPNRYNNRGGKLLQEEKERKKIAAKLPKVEEQLLQLSQNYTTDTGKVFTVYGQSIEQVIENKHMEHKFDKQCQLSARKQARAVTPVNVQASSTRTRLFSATKVNTNLFGTTGLSTPGPGPSAKRKRSPVYTPKTTNTLKPCVENIDPVLASTPAKSAKKNILSLKKSAGTTKRRSGPRRSGSKLQKVSKVNTKAILNASKSYANFKVHLESNAHLRSSIAPSKRGNTAPTIPSKPTIKISAPTPPRLTRQNTFSGTALKKTPRLTRSSSTMSPGSISGRMTTKNLPIII